MDEQQKVQITDQMSDRDFLEQYAEQVRLFRRCYQDLYRRARVELARELMLRRMPGVRC